MAKKTPATARAAPQFLAAFIVNIITMDVGYNIGWTAIALPLLEGNGTESEGHPLGEPITKEEGSWLASMVNLVGVVSPAIFNMVSHRWGRKACGYSVGIMFVVGCVGVMLSNSYALLMAARIFTGIAMGGVISVGSPYVADIAQDHNRGTLGTLFCAMFNLGILVVYIVGAVASFRVVNAGAIAIAAVFLVLFFFLPETPQYLLSKGRDRDAAKSLRWLRGSDYDVGEELDHIRRTIQGPSDQKEKKKASLIDLFRDRGARLGFIIVEVLVLNGQLCGLLVVINYSVEIFQAAGSTLPASWSAVAVAALQFVATFVSSVLVDRAGRRPLLMISNAGMAACLAALGGYFFVKMNGYDVSAIWWLPLTSLSLLVILGAIGVIPLLFVVINELFAPEMQHIAHSVAMGSLPLIISIVMKAYVPLLGLINIYGCFWLFSACCILCNLFIFFFLPETKGRPIEDIVAELSGKDRKQRSPRYDPVAMTEFSKENVEQ